MVCILKKHDVKKKGLIIFRIREYLKFLKKINITNDKFILNNYHIGLYFNGNFFGDLFGLITALGLAIGAVLVRSAKNYDLVPAAVAGKFMVAGFAIFFVESFALVETDIIIVPLMCVMCVALPFVLVTIAPRFISAAEVNLFFLLETIIGPIWVWLFINEQPTLETIQGGSIIILTIAIHSFLKIKNL